MTQKQLVLDLFNENPQVTIKQAAEQLSIKEPNIRRILGQGTIAGEFKRIGKGIYTLNTPDGQERAYIQMGKAQDVLPQLEAQGKKFDCVFLDIPYFSKALIGGNRGIKDYDFLLPNQFGVCLSSIKNMLRTDDTHVYLMLSGAPSAQRDMQQYLSVVTECGFSIVQEGKYKKLFANGLPVTNVRGTEAAAERLFLLTTSGRCRTGEIADIQMDFELERPAIRQSYPTQKNRNLLERLILQSTYEDEHTLDPCAGSGMFGVASVLLNRISTLIEPLESAIEKFITPNFQKILHA